MKEVTLTNGIPICPHCNKPTLRSFVSSSTTAAYYAPVYNEQGVNINPDKNTTTSNYHCGECNGAFTVTGNAWDGYTYIYPVPAHL